MLKFRTILLIPIIPLLAVALALMPLACGDDDDNREVWTDVSRSDSSTGSTDQVFLVDTSGNVNLTYTLELGATPMDVYFIFTNTTMSDAGSNPVVKSVVGEVLESEEVIMSDDMIDETQSVSQSINDELRVQSGTSVIAEFNQNPFKFITTSTTSILRSISVTDLLKYDTAGDTSSFYDDNGNSISATCRKVIAKDTGNGIPITLNIWIANNCWEGCSKSYCVNQDMVDALADKFIITGSNNDIYEWITNIFGIEWGSHGYPSQLISDNDEITIFLYDIDGDNATASGVLGFFYSRDNFFRNTDDSVLKYSNQRVMFYLDSVFYAEKDLLAWEVTDNWPSTIISTLAHEFQHMINFYQKNVLRANGAGTETWLNEMCSMVAEDFVASKLQVDGPRGVLWSDGTAGSSGNTEGRLPRYNYYNYISLVRWLTTYPSVLNSYSINYAFGAYLARNFGGAPFFKKLVQNQYTDYQAINYALTQSGYSEDFSSVMRKWAAANLLSDNETPPTGFYRYNSGTWFASTIGSTSYDLGSINLYNYSYSGQTGPRYFTSSVPYGKEAASNVYFLVGKNLKNAVTRSITMEDNIKLTVVVKQP